MKKITPNTIGKWLKAAAGISAAFGIYTFSPEQVSHVESLVIAYWAGISGVINLVQAGYKTWKAMQK